MFHFLFRAYNHFKCPSFALESLSTASYMRRDSHTSVSGQIEWQKIVKNETQIEAAVETDGQRKYTKAYYEGGQFFYRTKERKERKKNSLSIEYYILRVHCRFFILGKRSLYEYYICMFGSSTSNVVK